MDVPDMAYAASVSPTTAQALNYLDAYSHVRRNVPTTAASHFLSVAVDRGACFDLVELSFERLIQMLALADTFKIA
jgi:hypothetical protein